MRPLLAGVGISLLAAHAADAQSSAPPVAPAASAPAAERATDRLRWLAGCWERRAGDRVVEEQWMVPRGGTLLGTSRTTRGAAVVEYEFVRIAEAGDTLVYAAAPSGQPPAEFRAAAPAAGATEIVFENPAHDFPQRVRYRLSGPDSLLARIEGTRNGQARAVDFPYRRVPCAAPRPTPRPAEVAAPLPSVPLLPELDRVLRDYERAWQARDAAGLAALFAEDGFVLRGGHPPVRGREGIRQAYAGSGGPLALRALAYSTSGDVGYIIGAYGEREGVDDGKFVLALRRGADGRWLIAADMDNPSPRARTSPAERQ